MDTGLALPWSFVAVNIAGVRESGIVGLVTTILKRLPLTVIGTVGLWFVNIDHLPPMKPSTVSAVYVFATPFALTFWSSVLSIAVQVVFSVADFAQSVAIVFALWICVAMAHHEKGYITNPLESAGKV